jgi:glycosyltransferase involved in cell wall biosynthesis
MTLVSIVMAARDAEATIGEAIASVLAQTHQDWELVVVDDGSTDRTREIASSFADPRIRVLEAGRVGVLARLRNRGIKQTTGDWVAVLDADDAWLPAKLERQLATAGDAGVLHTDAYRLVGDRREHVPVERRPGPLFEALVENNFVYSSSVLVRRALLAEHGAFDPDPALWGSPDYELWLRLAPVTTFHYLDEQLLLYRVHGGQMSADVRRMSRGAIAALEKSSSGRDDPDYLRRLGMLRCLARVPGRGRRDLLRALRRRPLDPIAWKWLARSLAPMRGSARAEP